MGVYPTQIKAIFKRRFTVYWRSKGNTIVTLLIAIACAIIPMIIFLTAQPVSSHGGELLNFGTYKKYFSKIARIKNGSSNNQIVREIEARLLEKAKKEISSGISVAEYDTILDYNTYITGQYDQKSFSEYYFGYHFENGYPYLGDTKIDGINRGGNNTVIIDQITKKAEGELSFIVTANYTDPSVPSFLDEVYSFLTSKSGINSKIQFYEKKISGFDPSIMINAMLQWFVPLAFIMLHTLFVGEIVNEKSTPIRQFFYANGLKPLTYWIGNAILDLIIYEVFAIIYFIFLIAPGIPFAKHFAGILIFSLMINGPGMVCYTYCFSFICKTRIISSVILLFATVFLMLIPFIVELLMGGSPLGDAAGGILSGLCPATALRDSINILSNPTNLHFSNSDLMSMSRFSPHIFGCLFSLFLWPLVLFLGDYITRKAKEDTSKMLWTENELEFEDFKKNFHITDEASGMENLVLNGNNDFAVKVIKAGKAFKKSNGRPFAAVNDVSLGIQRGSLFGFLGANGAGKSTMINMIQDQLTLSTGEIYVDGVRVGNKGSGVDPKLLAVCPQFDDFLTKQFTPIEQLRFFGSLQGLSESELTTRVNYLIEKLDLTAQTNKLIGELSGGNQRKVAIASAFLSQANTILLDEPTTSLDPVARRHVHDLIRETKKNTNKTFMLTTHMLDEAEDLCDNISIMLHGCLYAIGTPQFLASKFGKSWKVDMILDDSTAETAERIGNWMTQQLPEAQLSLSREYSRIYSIPSSNMKLTDLFKKLIQGQTSRNGIKYFTCSSSTLEKVFLEIVELSEQSNTNVAIDDEDDEKRLQI